MTSFDLPVAFAQLLDDTKILRNTLFASQSKIHGFMGKILQLAGVSVEQFHAAMADTLSDMERILGNGGSTAEDNERITIPRVVHRIWLTSPKAPSEPPEHHLEKMLNEAEAYSGNGWTHRLWVQNPALIPRTAERINERGNWLLLTSIDNHLDGGKWREVFESFLASRKFPFAADILRMRILLEFGGIYADLGARFRDEPTARLVCDEFDCAMIFWETMFFQNSLIAMHKNSPIAEAFIRIAEQPYSIPKSLLEPLDGITEGMAFSGLLITGILLSQDIRRAGLCMLAPNAGAVEWASEQSWYTQENGVHGKFGNVYVPATGPSFFRHELLGSAEADPVFSEIPFSRTSAA